MKIFRAFLTGSALVVALVGAAASISATDAWACRDGNSCTPACDGLSCTKKSDCGSKCFCNNPQNSGGTCYVD